MAPGFVIYDQGAINTPSQALRIGNLVVDYHKPQNKLPYTHEEIRDLTSVATVDELTDCFFSKTSEGSRKLSFGLQELLALNNSRKNKEIQAVGAPTSTRVQLDEVSKFLVDEILPNEQARTWLRAHLSVGRRFSLRRALPPPKVWLCVGIISLKDARSFSLHSSSQSDGGSIAIPVDPTGIATLFNINAGAKVQFTSGNEIVAGMTVKGEKVWAALWRRVGVNYSSAEKSAQVQMKDRATFQMMEDYSTRRGGDKVEIAEIELNTGDSDIDEKVGDKKWNDQDWEDYLETVEETMEDLQN